MSSRQRVEAEADVKEPLSQLRQIASIYSNAPIAHQDVPGVYNTLHANWWQHMCARARADKTNPDAYFWPFFLQSQLSQDELETITKIVFLQDAVSARAAAAPETRRRITQLITNLGERHREMLYLLLGAAILSSWGAVKNLNSLLNARDRTKRQTPRAVLAAINAAALERLSQHPADPSKPPQLLPVDVEVAFLNLRPGEEPGSASRRATPMGSRTPTPAPAAAAAPTAPPPAQVPDLDPASSANPMLPPPRSAKKRPAPADDYDAAWLPPRLSKRPNLRPPLGSPPVAASPEAATTTAEPETGRDADLGLGAGQLEEETEDLGEAWQPDCGIDEGLAPEPTSDEIYNPPSSPAAPAPASVFHTPLSPPPPPPQQQQQQYGAWSDEDKDWDKKKDDDDDHMDLWRRVGELVLGLPKPRKEGIFLTICKGMRTSAEIVVSAAKTFQENQEE
ncbi:hypothetical protein LY76DRAFT_650890 [Colletotrichum caudatum]|nr:hypothetical protein LY76DRAFT_650890 [Colletotrichum caudatum]